MLLSGEAITSTTIPLTSTERMLYVPKSGYGRMGKIVDGGVPMGGLGIVAI